MYKKDIYNINLIYCIIATWSVKLVWQRVGKEVSRYQGHVRTPPHQSTISNTMYNIELILNINKTMYNIQLI